MNERTLRARSLLLVASVLLAGCAGIKARLNEAWGVDAHGNPIASAAPSAAPPSARSGAPGAGSPASSGSAAASPAPNDPDPRLTRALSQLKLQLAVRKLPSLKPDDLGDFDKVKEAFAVAEPSMLFMTTPGTYTNSGSVIVVPDGAQPVDKGHTVGLLLSENNATLMDGYEEVPYPGGMPALAWDGSIVGALLTIHLVTADGRQLNALYSLTETPPSLMRPSVKPYDPAATWPPPVDYALYANINWVVRLSEQGRLPKEIGAALHAVEVQAGKCAEATWKPYDAQLDAINNADLLEETRDNRRSDVRERGGNAVRRGCSPIAKGLVAPMRKAVEARRAEQAKLYEALRATLKK